VAGAARGTALVLDEPLSLWGGLDPESGRIIDRRHPQLGRQVSGCVLVLPVGRGSSSASSILLETVRLGTAPAAILLAELDAILALGATVARELYGKGPPVLILGADDYQGLRTGMEITVGEDGVVSAEPLTAE
jgi:predicted aconitase with swiveling domain